MINRRNFPISPLKISRSINKEDIKQRTNSRINLSNQSTVISELNKEQNLEDFLIRIHKIMHSNQKISDADISMEIYS